MVSTAASVAINRHHNLIKCLHTLYPELYKPASSACSRSRSPSTWMPKVSPPACAGSRRGCVFVRGELGSVDFYIFFTFRAKTLI